MGRIAFGMTREEAVAALHAEDPPDAGKAPKRVKVDSRAERRRVWLGTLPMDLTCVQDASQRFCPYCGLHRVASIMPTVHVCTHKPVTGVPDPPLAVRRRPDGTNTPCCPEESRA